MNVTKKSCRSTLLGLLNANFIGRSQCRAIESNCRGEEGAFFQDKVFSLASQIESMPSTYGQDGLGMNAIAHLHYFTAGCDFYITEKDAGSPDDSLEESQWQAFGMSNIGYGGEIGYICLPEILAAGAELDLYWTPKPLSECK